MPTQVFQGDILELLTLSGMKSILLICSSICLYLTTFSQEQETRIIGTVYKMDQPALFARLYLLENTDTINVYETNETGKFSMTSIFCPANTYTLLVSSLCSTAKIALYSPGISTHFASLYQFDSLNVLPCCTYKMPATTTYAINSTEPITQFNLKELQLLMNEYPGIRLQFFQIASRQDSKRVIRKRMEQFEKDMLNSGIPPNRLIFPADKTIPESYIKGISVSDSQPQITLRVIFAD